MSKLLAKIHQHIVPKFNPIIANGVSVAQMENALRHIDNAMVLTASSFPPGLKYEGFKKCTEMEEFLLISNRKNQQHTLELAPSNVYAVNFYFSYNGEMLPPKPIFIPYLERAGRISIRGKTFTVLPVLADETLSVSKNDIYVPFLAAKVTFKRMQYWFTIDGIHSNQYLVYSKIHNHDPNKQVRRSTRANLTIRCNSSIPHYLFGKYGIREVFKRYCGIEDIHFLTGTVDESKFPSDKYAICQSSQLRPRSARIKHYTPSELKVVLPRRYLSNNGVLGMLCGLFYAADHYPERITPETLDGTEDEIRLWRVLLGHIVFRNKDSEGLFFTKINEHYESLDLYVDDMTREGLEAQGYIVSDLYDLMALLIFDFTEILMKTDPASMYGKVLAVNRYVLADIIRAINVFRYKVTSIKNRELTVADINKVLSKHLKPEIIFNGLNKHNEIISTQCAGDNIMFNYTSKVILQDKATGVTKRKGGISFKDPSKLLHSSIATAGSILALPKSEPTGRTVLSPYASVDRGFKIRKPPELAAQLDYIQSKINRE